MDTQPTPAFSDYLAALKRRRGLMIGIALPIVAIALLLAIGLPEIYRSSALIEIETDMQRSDYLESGQGREEPSYADQYVASLKSVVLSDENLNALLQEQSLYAEQEQNPSAAVRRLQRDIDVQIVTVPVLDPRSGREREIVTAFTVAHEHREPQKAHQVAQWLVEEFLAANRNQYRRRAASASEFFGVEAERMGSRIAELEARLAEFKRENIGRLPELNEVNMNVMDRTERDLDNLQLQARTLRRERVFLTSQLQQVLAANPQAASVNELEAQYQRLAAQYDASHPDVISLRRQIDNLRRGSPALGASLEAQLATERSVLAEATQRYSADHPDVRRIQRSIEALEARIASGEEVDTTVDTPVAMQLKTQIAAIDTQLGAIEARSAEVRRKLEQVESDVVSSPQVEQKYQTLTRDLSIARTKYEELLRRQMDSQIGEAAIAAGRADEFRVVQLPLLPTQPAKPQRAAISLLGLVLAVVIALSGALIVEFLDPTVRGTRDVREVLSISPLAAVPEIRNSTSRRRQLKRSLTAAAAMMCGIFIVYYAIVQSV